MRIPEYGELFRRYKTETKYLFTIRNTIPYEGMHVRGPCGCYYYIGKEIPRFTAQFTRNELRWRSLRYAMWKVPARLDKNLIPICSYCKNPMPEEHLDGFNQVDKIITQTRCKYKSCAGKSFRYRMDPVPNTGNWGGGYSIPNGGYKQSLQEASTYPRFHRGKRCFKALQDMRRYSCEHNSPYAYKSWKDCTKKKYQWMKKSNKSKWSIEKQDRLWEEYLFNNDNYLGPRYITKLEYLIGESL